MFETATVFLLMPILVEGLHEVDAVAVASRGSHPTRAKPPHTTPMDVTHESASLRDVKRQTRNLLACLGAPPDKLLTFPISFDAP
jgi:hypothetical protein